LRKLQVSGIPLAGARRRLFLSVDNRRLRAGASRQRFANTRFDIRLQSEERDTEEDIPASWPLQDRNFPLSPDLFETFLASLAADGAKFLPGIRLGG
jgi:hypothetical protein